MTAALTTPSSWAGVFTNGATQLGDSGIEFEICGNNTWRVTYNRMITFDVANLASHTMHLTLGAGKVTLRPVNHIQVDISPVTAQFIVNGVTVANLIDERFGTPTNSIGISVDWDSARYTVAAADFTNFRYTPVGF